MIRSILFGAILILFSSFGFSKDLPEPVKWKEEIKSLIFDEEEKILDGTGVFKLETPYRALDAAMVPINVKFPKNQTDEVFVKSLTLIVDENPAPVVGKFNFTAKSGNASLVTRIRVDKYTYVRAVAEMSDNKKYMVANYVKAAGGCSAPSLADMDAVMARLGKMKVKFIETNSATGSIDKAELVISHPNFSGFQFNQLTRAEIPAHFINNIKISQDGKTILEASPDISLSEDPSIIFHYVNSGGPIEIKFQDSEGQKFSGEFSGSQLVHHNN